MQTREGFAKRSLLYLSSMFFPVFTENVKSSLSGSFCLRSVSSRVIIIIHGFLLLGFYVGFLNIHVNSIKVYCVELYRCSGCMYDYGGVCVRARACLNG